MPETQGASCRHGLGKKSAIDVTFLSPIAIVRVCAGFLGLEDEGMFQNISKVSSVKESISFGKLEVIAAILTPCRVELAAAATRS